MKTQIVHFGAHFFITLAIATCYLIATPNKWLGWLVFCLIMFMGWLIDIDHFLGNGSRCRQMWRGLKAGHITIGNPNPNRVNYFHTWWMWYAVITLYMIMIFAVRNIILAYYVLAAYLIHVIIDMLDCDNQNIPHNNPLPSYTHIHLYRKYSWFRRLCFNKELLK